MKTTTVIAAEGRKVPIHPRVKTAPGGKLLIVDDREPVVLPDVSFVRRRINAGDLCQVAPKPAMPASAPTPAKEK